MPSSAPTSGPTSPRRFKRATALLSAGLLAATLSIGGGIAANAASSILNTTTVSPSAMLTVTVSSGLSANEALTVKLDNAIDLTTAATADGSGAYTTTISIPTGTSVGAHTIDVVPATSPAQSENITVIANPTVAPTTASVTASVFGTTGVTLTFSGFTAGDSVLMSGGDGSSGGVFSATALTANGAGTVTYTVKYSDFGPGAVVPGTYSVAAQTVAGNVFSNTATITVTADPAAPATPVKNTARFTG